MDDKTFDYFGLFKKHTNNVGPDVIRNFLKIRKVAIENGIIDDKQIDETDFGSLLNAVGKIRLIAKEGNDCTLNFDIVGTVERFSYASFVGIASGLMPKTVLHAIGGDAADLKIVGGELESKIATAAEVYASAVDIADDLDEATLMVRKLIYDEMDIDSKIETFADYSSKLVKMLRETQGDEGVISAKALQAGMVKFWNTEVRAAMMKYMGDDKFDELINFDRVNEDLQEELGYDGATLILLAAIMCLVNTFGIKLDLKTKLKELGFSAQLSGIVPDKDDGVGEDVDLRDVLSDDAMNFLKNMGVE